MKRWLWPGLKILGSIVAVLVAVVVALVIIVPPSKPMAVSHQGVTLSGVTVVNPGIGRRANQTVTVVGGKIKTIGQATGSGASRYAGAYVLPGLIDMHVHNPAPQAGDLNFFFLM